MKNRIILFIAKWLCSFLTLLKQAINGEPEKDETYTATQEEVEFEYIKKKIRSAALNKKNNDDQYTLGRDPYEVAAKADCVVVIPDNHTIQLDIDSEEQYSEFIRTLREIEKKTPLQFAPYIDTPSKSGLPNRHITLTSQTKMGVWQRLALQFVLGSDPKRERLNLLRVLRGNPIPIAFFEKQ